MPLKFGVSNTHRESRKALRRQSGTPAWIRVEKEFAVRSCTIVDISADGAQLKLSSPQPVPEEFKLLLSRDAHGRSCRLKWRRGTSLGAEFL